MFTTEARMTRRFYFFQASPRSRCLCGTD